MLLRIGRLRILRDGPRTPAGRARARTRAGPGEDEGADKVEDEGEEEEAGEEQEVASYYSDTR